MKRTLLLSILAVIPAALTPLSASSQILPHPKAASQGDEPTYKYRVYAGYAYTALNQVTQSRSGLQGVEAAVSRDFGRYFALTADGSFYKYAFSSPEITNSTLKPSVDMVLFGPELHANLYSKTNGFFHGLLGGEHVGGTSQTPNISFAGGVGGGLEYQLSPRLSVRASGDVILQSFSVVGNSAALGYSPHETRSARATVGVAYHF
ncbi:MAG: hypothetical protein WBQ94_27670 [Terracidiphilus sp.]